MSFAIPLLLIATTHWASDSPPTIDFNEGRKIEIPINYDLTRKARIDELRLYVSEDKGKTWRRVATAKPDAKFFSYEAPREGVFSFGLVIVGKDGRHDPTEIAQLVPAYHIRFGVTANRLPFGQSDVADRTWEALRALYHRDTRTALDWIAGATQHFQVRFLEYQLAESRKEVRELRTKLDEIQKNK